MPERSIPSRDECLRMLAENGVPANIVAHSKLVAEIALELGRALVARGERIDLRLVEAGALLHDICKHEGFGKPAHTPHGDAGADYLAARGLEAPAEVVRAHVMEAIEVPGMLDTWEKKLVFYADKRVNHDRRVTFDERMEYLVGTYPSQAAMFRRVAPAIRRLEQELLKEQRRRSG